MISRAKWNRGISFIHECFLFSSFCSLIFLFWVACWCFWWCFELLPEFSPIFIHFTWHHPICIYFVFSAFAVTIPSVFHTDTHRIRHSIKECKNRTKISMRHSTFDIETINVKFSGSLCNRFGWTGIAKWSLWCYSSKAKCYKLWQYFPLLLWDIFFSLGRTNKFTYLQQQQQWQLEWETKTGPTTRVWRTHTHTNPREKKNLNKKS